MTKLQPKQPPLRLAPELYRQLCRQVMERDSWRCQSCGSKQNLQVHHKRLRSQQGPDTDLNLITLCATCHERLHRAT
jgi:5-methylcytosine-specific restriction endonuclease McrA